MSRWIGFTVAILIGAGLGLLYGWVIRPVDYVDTSPDTLRIDYKTDYVLMVAESYEGDGDLQLAVRRIAVLGATSPVEMIFEAIFIGIIGSLDLRTTRLVCRLCLQLPLGCQHLEYGELFRI